MLEGGRLAQQSNDSSFQGVWDELLWRGLVKVSTDEGELRTLLNDGTITFYCGFDPTAPSLHVGNLVQLLLMRRLQLAGHTPLGLVGGSTGLIGDPRPTAERVLNDVETVNDWVLRLQSQVSVFLSQNGSNGLRLVNNLDWFGKVSALDFLRDIGKFFRVGPMLKKEAVRKRLESDAGISFTKFSYQILQASDFLELFRTENCVLQTGGSDQWGNLLGGVELIGRSEGAKVHAMGTPLIENSDGTKFGKSEGNAIWLDGSMCSPFAFFQFWMNTTDVYVVSRLKVFTFLSRAEIDKLADGVKNMPFRREAQNRLALEVTSLVHGTEAAEKVAAASRVLFGAGDLSKLDEDVLQDAVTELGGVPAEVGEKLTEVMVRAGLADSLGDARRIIGQKGMSVNNEKVVDVEKLVAAENFLFGRSLVLKKGKKQLAGVRLT